MDTTTTDKPLHILLVENDPEDASTIVDVLKTRGLSFTHAVADNAGKFGRELASNPPDVIISDYRMPDFGALEVLAMLREKDCDIPVIVATGSVSEDVVAETMKMGAADYILKDNLLRLIHSVKRSVETSKQMKKALKTVREREKALVAAQKMEIVGRLAGGVAHDFNNILAAISGYTEFIAREVPKGSQAAQDADKLRKTVEYASILTRQLLAFTSKQVLIPKVFDINVFFSDSRRMFQRLLGEAVTLKIEQNPELWRIEADLGQIEQVFLNLLINSRDAMPSGGTVTISGNNISLSAPGTKEFPELKPGDYVRLRVADTGTGIAEEHKPRIFEPFFTTKEYGKGTGLGLPTIQNILSRYGGSVRIDSRPGEGTEAVMLLPKTTEEPAPLNTVKKGRRSGGSETILAVEDSENLRGIITRTLESAGYNVIPAASGEEALEKAAGQGENIALVLTDIVLPGINGHEMVRRLRLLNKNFRVIYTSGYTADETVRKTLMEEGSEFLPKPFSPLTLQKKVRQILNAG
ncbi:MAG: response regulator [bacterium]